VCACCVAIRKMVERKKKTVEGRLVRSTITDGYADFGSQAYAPLTRVGIFFDRNSEQYVVKNKYLANYAGWHSVFLVLHAALINLNMAISLLISLSVLQTVLVLS